MSGEKYLIVIIGPTAVGKTSISIQIANHFQTEIISADSRQFYKQTTIGTAKPSDEELKLIPHHFINSLSIEQEYTAAQFEKEAIDCIKEIHKKNKIAIMAGGSGLFVRAVLDGLDNLPSIDPEIRKKLNEDFLKNGIKYLQTELKKLDPEYYLSVDLANPQRIIRALEVSISTGRPYSSYRRGNKKQREFIPIKIGLNLARPELYDRINSRVDQMISYGLVEEAKELYPFRKLNSMQTVGYTEIFDYLEGKFSLETAIENIKQNSRRLAKRQLTWFTKDLEIKWFDGKSSNEIFKFIASQLKSS